MVFYAMVLAHRSNFSLLGVPVVLLAWLATPRKGSKTMKKCFITWGSDGVVRIVKNKRTFVGRKIDCVVRLINDTSVSRVHCSLLWDGQSLVLKDEGSRNGTFVNKNPIADGQEVELSEGDVFHCGQTELTVHLDDNPTAEIPLDSPTTPM